MDFKNQTFFRKFSLNLYKSLKLPLGQMSFTKDFINDTRSNLYPIINKSDDCREVIADNRYTVDGGSVERVVGEFFPFASYHINFDKLNGEIGFVFNTKSSAAKIYYNSKDICLELSNGHSDKFECFDALSEIIVSCRVGAFDIYSVKNGNAYFLHTFSTAQNDLGTKEEGTYSISNALGAVFMNSNSQSELAGAYTCIFVSGSVVVENVDFYIDCGVSQADIRPVRYENGEVMYENGKVYLTVTCRLQREGYQGVFSWTPGTADFSLTGVMLYNAGDGFINGDLASCLLYNRKESRWFLWVCSFAHDHVLAHAAFSGDPRFGVNAIDVKLMQKEESNADISKFRGFEGDEDPVFFYNEDDAKWYMAICRLDPEIKSYKYVFFKSDKPFSDYEYIGKGCDGAETGGSFVRIDEELYFICGNGFNEKSNYRIYSKYGMSEAKFNFADGGFRGWGTVIPVKMGTRTRYFWLTFDRHNASDYNWSYGNLYCFEAF